MKKVLVNEFTVITAAVMIVSVYVITGVLAFANKQYNTINTENLKEAVTTLKGFTPAAVFSDAAAVAEWASNIGTSETEAAYRITLIGRNGQVIFDTDADSAAMENHLDRPEVQGAITKGKGTTFRHSSTLGQVHIYTAVAITDSSHQFIGILRLSRTIPCYYSRLLSSALPFLVIGIFIILGVCIGLYAYSRRVSLSIEADLNAQLEEKTRELKIKMAEAENESRRREVILNSMFEGVIALDSSLNIILANPRLYSLFGIDAEKDIRGMSLLEFSNSAELEKAAQTVAASGQPCELNLKRFVSGAEQQFQVYAAPLQTQAPHTSERETILRRKSSGVIMVLRDISRLVRLEQVRKDFAANVSHELRTPIQVIQGFAETILDSPPADTETLLHFARIIKKNAQSMENLTSDLLTLVSLEDETVTRPPLEEAALAPLITEAVDAVAINARSKNIDIAVSCPQELTAKVHSSLFTHAVINLLDNAIKYSGDKNGNATGFRIEVNAFPENADDGQGAGALLVEVKDNGIGIPAEHIDRIFERFYRIDRARSREAGGTGLGLSIVRHIALLHGGTVEAESHAGEGSVFRIRLPAI